MAFNTQLSTTARGAALDSGLSAQFNTGYLRIYSGAQPANANAATTGVKLAELRFSATAFPASSVGVATANAITSDPNAGNTGTAGYVRCFASDGTTVLMDGSVDTVAGGAGNLLLATLTINAGDIVSNSSFTITIPAAGS